MQGVQKLVAARLPADHHGCPHLADEQDREVIDRFLRGPARGRLRPAAAENPADAAARGRRAAHARLPAGRAAVTPRHAGRLRPVAARLPPQPHRDRPRRLRLPDPDRVARFAAGPVAGRIAAAVCDRSTAPAHLLPVRGDLRERLVAAAGQEALG